MTMKTIKSYAPSFFGKDADEKLREWVCLWDTGDFGSLISDYSYYLKAYISRLRKAEIFDGCSDAKAALEDLKAHISWEECLSVNYTIYASLPLYCGSVDEFVSYATKRSTVSSDWVVSEFREWGGGDYLDWELGESCRDEYPGEISVRCLSLACAEERRASVLSAV